MGHLLGQGLEGGGGLGEVAAGQQVVDALHRLARRQPGPAGAPVQLGQALGRPPRQPLAQRGLKELVIAVPLALGVEPYREQVPRDQVSAEVRARSPGDG